MRYNVLLNYCQKIMFILEKTFKQECHAHAQFTVKRVRMTRIPAIFKALFSIEVTPIYSYQIKNFRNYEQNFNKTNARNRFAKEEIRQPKQSDFKILPRSRHLDKNVHCYHSDFEQMPSW